MLSTQLESNQVNQILLLSNRLFQDKANPHKALHKFLLDSERYLKAQFACEAAQILLVDQQNAEFLSAGNIPGKSSLVMRGPTSQQSVANHVLNNELVYSYPPVRLAYLNASMLNRGLNVSSSLNISNRQQVWHLSFLFNAEVDLPQAFVEEKLQSGMEYRPNSFLAQQVLGSDNQYLAVIQLI
jgi:hypothetical protein